MALVRCNRELSLGIKGGLNMRKKLMLILCLILCAGMLAACSGGNQNERFPVISTQSIQNYNNTAATDAPSV